MKIFELNGMPGSGKSTLVSNCLKDLEVKNLHVASLEDVVIGNKKSRYNSYINLLKALISIENFTFNAAVILFTKDYPLKKARVMYAMRLIKLNYLLSKIKEKSQYNLLLIDEGLIQYITSIPHNTLIIPNTNFYRLCILIKNKSKNHVYVNCVLSAKENIKRLKKRNNQNNRFDNLPHKELEDLLFVRTNNLSQVRNQIINEDHITINMEEEITQNVERLLTFIELEIGEED